MRPSHNCCITDIIDKEVHINKFLSSIGLDVAVGVEQQSKDDQEAEVKLEKTYKFSSSDCDASQTEAIENAGDSQAKTKPADFGADEGETAAELEAGVDDNLQKTATSPDPNSTSHRQETDGNLQAQITQLDFHSDNDEAEAFEAEINLDQDSDETKGSSSNTSDAASASVSDETIEGISPPYLYFIVRTCGKGLFVMMTIFFTLASYGAHSPRSTDTCIQIYRSLYAHRLLTAGDPDSKAFFGDPPSITLCR